MPNKKGTGSAPFQACNGNTNRREVPVPFLLGPLSIRERNIG
jgi:hypothetical protein